MGKEKISKEDEKVAREATVTTPADADLEQLAEQSPDPVKDTHDSIEDSFFWAFERTKTRLDTLADQIDAKEDPPWYERLAEIALDAALMAGGAAGGEFLANALVAEEGKSVLHEFTKAAFEEGIDTAVAIGRGAFAGPTTSARFIAGQTEAALSAAQTRQTAWVMRGRHLVKTPAQAAAVRAAFSQANMRVVGDKQYAASRDAWVGYIAQSKYGEVERSDGSSTTNMMTQERREWTNRSAPGFVPDTAPDPGDAFLGRAPGVLEVVARVPDLDERGHELGQPEVVMALLNGISGPIREQYAHVRLADLAIPRQVTCIVDGDMPNFRIDVDEAGRIGSIPHAQSKWLRARVEAGDERAGARELLGELQADEIREKGL